MTTETHKEKLYQQQVERAQRIHDRTGLLITTCGHCGAVRLIDTNTDVLDREEVDIELYRQCYNCLRKLEAHLCPALFY